jgi:hypothetical protein
MRRAGRILKTIPVFILFAFLAGCLFDKDLFKSTDTHCLESDPSPYGIVAVVKLENNSAPTPLTKASAPSSCRGAIIP